MNNDSLNTELSDLREQVAELRAALAAICNGEVDAVILPGEVGEQVYTLKRADEAYLRLVEAMGQGAALINPDGLITYCNPAMARLAERSQETLIGKTLAELTPDNSTLPLTIATALKTGSLSRDFDLACTDGRTAPVQMTFTALILADTPALCVVCTDLRPRIHAERLLESERLFRGVIRQSSEAIIVLDRDGQILRANDAARLLCRYEPESKRLLDVLQLGLGDCPPAPAPTAAFVEKIELFIASETPLREEFVTAVNDADQIVYLKPSVAVLHSEAGRVLGCILVLTDISSLKRMEQKLVDSEKEFRRLAEAMPQIVWVANADGGVCYLNSLWLGFTGMTFAEGHGQGWLSAIHADDRLKVAEAWGQALRTGQAYRRECRIRRQDGVYRWWQVRGVPVFDADGNIQKWYGACTDIQELKTVEMELQENQELLNNIIDSSPSLIFSLDRQNRYTLANKAMADYLGLGKEMLLGRALHDVFPTGIADRLVADNERIMTTGEPLVIEESIASKAANQTHFVITSKFPLRNALGEIKGLAGVATDISEWKRAQDALRKSRYQLEAFIKQAPVSVAMFDRNMNYLAVSDRWSTEFGRGYEDLIGRNHYEVHPDLPQEWKRVHNQGLAGAFLRNDEDLWTQADGGEYWLRWTVSPWIDEQGEIGGIIMSSENITEKKLAEQELRIAAIAFESHEGIMITDKNKAILRVNRAFTDITGYSAAEVAGKNPKLLGSGYHDPAFYAGMWRSINQTGTWNGEIINRRKNGEIYPELITITAVRDRDGNPTHYIGMLTDITERKEAEQKLAHAYRQLELSMERHIQQEKLASLGVLVGGLAHEINNPLMGILNYIQYAQDHVTESRTREMLSKALKEVNRITRLVRGMLMFGRQTSDAESLADLSATLNHVLTLLAGELKAHDINMRLDLPGEALPRLAINADFLEQILLNLLLNAIYSLKASSANPREVLITARLVQDGAVEISLADNGAGVAAELRNKIFDPFFTTKPPGEGTGLGLAISRQIAEAALGRLELTNSPRGVCFTLTLPSGK